MSSIIKQIRFTDEQIEKINRYAEIKGYTYSEAVRQLCDKGLEIEVSNENINLMVEIIDERLRSILKPSLERIISISAKGAIMSATSVFLNGQALSDFVPENKRRDFKEAYNRARLKGVAYIKSKSEDL